MGGNSRQSSFLLWVSIRTRLFRHRTVFGLFTGGFGAHYGARKIGAVAIPTSSGNSKRQINIMKDFWFDIFMLYTFICSLAE